MECFFRCSKPRPSGERSNDELDILEIESKLRRRSTDDRPRLFVLNSMGDAVRFVVDGKLALPETYNRIRPER